MTSREAERTGVQGPSIRSAHPSSPRPNPPPSPSRFPWLFSLVSRLSEPRTPRCCISITGFLQNLSLRPVATKDRSTANAARNRARNPFVHPSRCPTMTTGECSSILGPHRRATPPSPSPIYEALFSWLAKLSAKPGVSRDTKNSTDVAQLSMRSAMSCMSSRLLAVASPLFCAAICLSWRVAPCWASALMACGQPPTQQLCRLCN